MYARVARFEGADADALRRSAAQMLPIDPENGRGLGVGLFETADDLRTGDATLNAMSPPEDGVGRRVSVEMHEVAVDLRAQG